MTEEKITEEENVEKKMTQEEQEQYLKERMDEVYEIEEELNYREASEADTVKNIENLIASDTMEDCLKKYQEQIDKDEAIEIENIDKIDNLFDLKDALIETAYDNISFTLDDFDD